MRASGCQYPTVGCCDISGITYTRSISRNNFCSTACTFTIVQWTNIVNPDNWSHIEPSDWNVTNLGFVACLRSDDKTQRWVAFTMTLINLLQTPIPFTARGGLKGSLFPSHSPTFLHAQVGVVLFQVHVFLAPT